MAFKHDHTQVLDVAVDRVQKEYSLNPACKSIRIVEDCGHIHEKQRKHVIQILRIPEKNIQCRKDHSNSDVQHGERNDGIDDCEHAGIERHMVQRYENKEHHQRQPEI